MGFIRVISFLLLAYTFTLFLAWSIIKRPIQSKLTIENYHLMNPSTRNQKLGLYLNMKLFFIETFSSSKPAVSFLLHSVFAFTGIFIDPFYHSLHLMLFVNISSSAMYIIQAITKRLKILVNTLLVALFIVYSYALITANYYSDQFLDKEVDMCGSLESCFFYTMNLGLRFGGGIAESMKLYHYGADLNFGYKLLYDISFFIILNIIILNIVFGVIIDTFGEMRDEAYERDEKLKNTCLLCLNERQDVEEAGVNFKSHKENEHDIWLYIYFIKYLHHKKELDYTPEENEAWSNYQSKKTDWMPLKSSLFLKEMDKDEKDRLEDLHEQLEIMEDKLLRCNKEVVTELERMQESQNEFKVYMDKKFDILMCRIGGGMA